jgi:hypothetical protein
MSDLTTQQLIIIGLIFGVGLLIGFMLKPGGAKWRKLYDDERVARTRLREDYDRMLANQGTTAAPAERQTLRSGSF